MHEQIQMLYNSIALNNPKHKNVDLFMKHYYEIINDRNTYDKKAKHSTKLILSNKI